MLEIVQNYNDLAIAQYGILTRTLTGITPEELEWRPHPEANPIRWILGHHLWYEEWVKDAILNRGRFLSETEPLSFSFGTLDDFVSRFEAQMHERQAAYETLTEADLAREFNYLGKGVYIVSRLIRTHAAHFTGHTWQIRYIRGTYSRAYGTDKTVFDPF